MSPAPHVERWGKGPPVLLVHGAVTSGELAWGGVRALADRWTLLVVARPGYWPGPPAGEVREDFAADAAGVAEILTAPTHVVGHSYGAVVSLLAAAQRPDAVRSLVVSEPPAFGLAPESAAARTLVADLEELWASGPADPEAFLRLFMARAGAPPPPDPLPAPLRQNADRLRTQRFPWHADVPLADLRALPVPKLVVSGGHSPAYDAVCEALAARVGAERAVVPGAGHAVPRAPGYAGTLSRFLSSVER